MKVTILLIVIIFLAVELYLLAKEPYRTRYVREMNVIQYNAAWVRYDSVLGYTLQPGVLQFANSEFSTRISVGGDGFRANKVTADLVFLGDSFTMGCGVADSETFAHLLGGYNRGISGYNNLQHYLAWQRAEFHLPAFLLWNETDLRENLGVYPSPRLENGDIVYPTEKNFRRYISTVKFFRALPLSCQWILSRVLFEPSKDMQFEKLKEILTLFSGKGIVFCYLPLLKYYETGESDFLRFKETCDSLRLEVFDLRPWLCSADYYYLDGHLNKFGHEAVARAIRSYMERKGK